MEFISLEWIGYSASIIVVFSMMVHSLIQFRWINLLGALLFSIYGFLIDAIPVGILNGIIVLIDVYYIVMIYSKKETFEILEIPSESTYLGQFLESNKEQILSFNSNFTFALNTNTSNFFVLRNRSISGLFITQRKSDTELIVILDFVLPEYKDDKIVKYIYSLVKDHFKALGFNSIIAASNNQKQVNYLKNLGFQEVTTGVYRKEL